MGSKPVVVFGEVEGGQDVEAFPSPLSVALLEAFKVRATVEVVLSHCSEGRAGPLICGPPPRFLDEGGRLDVGSDCSLSVEASFLGNPCYY